MSKTNKSNNENVITVTDVVVKEPAEGSATEQLVEVKESSALTLQDLYKMDEERQERVLAFAEQIDLSDQGIVMNYAATTLKNISNGCSEFIKSCKGSEEEKIVKQQLSDALGLIVKVKNKEPNLFQKLFQSASEKYEDAKKKYQSLNSMIEDLEKILETQITIMDENIDAEDAYGIAHIQALQIIEEYIVAGHYALEKAKRETLPLLEGRDTGGIYNSELVDYKRNLRIFEKKLTNLELMRSQTTGTVGMVALEKTTSMDSRVNLCDSIQLNMTSLRQLCSIALIQARNQISNQVTENVTEATNKMTATLSKEVCGTAIEIAKKSSMGFMDPAVTKEALNKLLDTAKEMQAVYESSAQKLQESVQAARNMEEQVQAILSGAASGANGSATLSSPKNGSAVKNNTNFGGLQL